MIRISNRSNKPAVIESCIILFEVCIKDRYSMTFIDEDWTPEKEEEERKRKERSEQMDLKAELLKAMMEFKK